MKNSSSASEATMKQQCTLTNLYFGLLMFAILYAGGVVFFAYRDNWPILVLWLPLLPCARWVGLWFSPLISKWRGQGPVDDKLPSSVTTAHVEVAFYSSERLSFLHDRETASGTFAKGDGFHAHEDRPYFQTTGSVPVVEVGKERLIGNATTELLARLNCWRANMRAI
jgi:hypothetical protein